MKIAPVPANEQERLKALSEYFTLDTLPEDNFNDITTLASTLCDAPVSFVCISGADRQWLRSGNGLQHTDTIIENSFCLNTINAAQQIVIINDLTQDERFREDPMVTGSPYAVFYAGAQLVNPQGYVLGALCVLDTEARTLSGKQIASLQALAKQAVTILELRKKEGQLQQKQTELNSTAADLEKIAHIASHDLKSPLNNIISLTHLLKDDYSKKLDEEGNEYISFLNDASYQLSDMVSGIVSYTRTAQLPVEQREDINVAALLDEIKSLLSIPANAAVTYDEHLTTIRAPRAILKQVLLQLMHNALQYNSGDHIMVAVRFHENKHAVVFEVQDNGIGIADEDKEKIFDLFERLQKKINGESMGIGLSLARRLAGKIGGEIKLESTPGQGSTFVFTVPK